MRTIVYGGSGGGDGREWAFSFSYIHDVSREGYKSFPLPQL